MCEVFLLCFDLHYLSIYSAPPTAELEPLASGKVAQLDEVSISIIYKILEYLSIIYNTILIKFTQA